MEEANQLASSSLDTCTGMSKRILGKGDQAHCATWRYTASTYFLGIRGEKDCVLGTPEITDANPVSN